MSSPWLYALVPGHSVQRWQLGLEPLLVGRAENPNSDDKAGVSGDPSLSRRQFEVRYDGEALHVTACPESRNPLVFEGQVVTVLRVLPGQHFLTGQSEFRLVLHENEATFPPEAVESTLAHDTREQARDRQASRCLEALTRLLPRLRAQTELIDQWQACVEVLRGLMPQAGSLQVLEIDLDALAAAGTDFATVVCTLTDHPEPPSRRLLRSAFDRNETVLHVWSAGAEASSTQVAGARWALAAPIRESARVGYAMLVLGSDSGPDPGDRERVLVDLIAETMAHYLVLRRQHQLEGQVGQFFSPRLRTLLLHQDPVAVMKPTLRPVTMLFFDLRGFSKATEAAESGGNPEEQMLLYHDVLTEVITIVTEAIFGVDGIVVDYQGDATMACWGAPLPQRDQAERAVRAALAITSAIHAMHLPFGTPSLRCGIGLASGTAVTGRVGARNQVKYGVLGRVVNLASRLEGLTKYLGVPILASQGLREQLPPDILCRRVGKVRPAGLDEASGVYEIVVAPEAGGSGATAEQLTTYHAAEAHFAAGRFGDAQERLRQLPAGDPVASFLSRASDRACEEGMGASWTGVLEFHQK
jgi:adenylate cyclase